MASADRNIEMVDSKEGASVIDGCDPDAQTSVPQASPLAAARLESLEPLPEQPFRVIVICGPPASGKGTVCDSIKKRYGLVHISIGEIIRSEIEKDTDMGRRGQRYSEIGKLLPFDIVVEILARELNTPRVMKRGCLLDNFPITVDQAHALRRILRVDKFISVNVSEQTALDRALGRCMDPVTGKIYHMKERPPPEHILPRLVQRRDDTEEVVRSRFHAFQDTFEPVRKLFDIQDVDGTLSVDKVRLMVVNVLRHLEWTSEDCPYFGSVAFAGAFSSANAKRAGFYSPEDPPEIGDKVVCFRRGKLFSKRGVVQDVEEKESDGRNGLRRGHEGIKVEAAMEDGETFFAWSAFLAPVNDMEYSSICTTTDFKKSVFTQVGVNLFGADVTAAGFSPKATTDAEARDSLKTWLENLEDADEEEVGVKSDVVQSILSAFDAQEADPALYLYSTNETLAPRTSLTSGKDYSRYFRALNNTINCDAEGNLTRAMPLIHRMLHNLFYTEPVYKGQKRLYPGGRVYKGDVQRPVPLNMNKLRLASELHKTIRFRQFQSTTTDEALADKYRKREDGRGYKWVIDIPTEFWGARDIRDLSWKSGESEVLLPAYSAFYVDHVDEDCCHLRLIDRGHGLQARARRHGFSDGVAVVQIATLPPVDMQRSD